MKYGHVTKKEIENMDLHLPDDNPKNKDVLSGKPNKTPKIYIGCAKWGRDEWIGLIYPEKTKAADFLKNYVNHFNGIELNGTFYQTRKNNIESWSKIADEGFKFCPKFSRRISHIKRLKIDDESTEWYFDSIEAFGESLGLPFLQLPDNFAGKYLDRVRDYLENAPAGIPYSIELRHTEWFSEPEVAGPLAELLKKHNVTFVITDSGGRRDAVHQTLTTAKAFVRFIGYDLHESDYTRMDEWALKLKDWFDQGLEEAYFFCHQENETHTPRTADYMVKKVNEVFGLSLKRPIFISEDQHKAK